MLSYGVKLPQETCYHWRSRYYVQRRLRAACWASAGSAMIGICYTQVVSTEIESKLCLYFYGCQGGPPFHYFQGTCKLTFIPLNLCRNTSMALKRRPILCVLSLFYIWPLTKLKEITWNATLYLVCSQINAVKSWVLCWTRGPFHNETTNNRI